MGFIAPSPSTLYQKEMGLNFFSLWEKVRVRERDSYFVVAQNHGDRTALHLLLDAYPFGHDIAVRVLGANSWCNASLRCNAKF